MQCMKDLKFKDDAYLTPVIPFGIYRIVDSFGSKTLFSNFKDSIRIRFAFAGESYILLHQIFGFYYVNSEYTLKN